MIATLLATAATAACHVGYSHHLPAPDNAALERMNQRRLSFGEWRSVWACRLRYWLCKLRGGHKWGPWGYEEPMYGYGASHSCVRCEYWERDEATW